MLSGRDWSVGYHVYRARTGRLWMGERGRWWRGWWLCSGVKGRELCGGTEDGVLAGGFRLLRGGMGDGFTIFGVIWLELLW